MKSRIAFWSSLLAALLFCIVSISAQAAEKSESKPIAANEKLVLVWTSADKEVATNMVLMYALNSKKFKWWDDITLVVWGPSQKLLLKDKELQDSIKQIKETGTDVKACKGCADMYGIEKDLQELGVIVEYIDLTGYIKEGRHILTF